MFAQEKMQGRHSIFVRRAMSAALISVGLVAGGGAWASSFTFTTSAQWATGTLTNTNGSPPPTSGNGHIRLNDNIITPFDNIWVALSGRDGAVRIDTNVNPLTIGDHNIVLTPAEAGGTAVRGEYLTRPAGMAGNPSRTTVDGNGDVWVGNRNEGSGGMGSITKISANPTGATSSGMWNGSTFDRLAWTNAGGADSNGGVTTAADSAISQYVRTTGANVRHVSVDRSNNVWVGGGPLDAGDQVFELRNGSTGAVVNTPGFGAAVPDNNTGGYGGLVDGNGVVWSAGLNGNSLTRFDPATGARMTVNQGGRQSYGMGIDNEGNIWNATWTNNTLDRINPDGTVAASYNLSAFGNGLRGVAVTADDNIWVASSYTNTVLRVSNTGVVLAQIAVGATPTGVAVDSKGKLWVTDYESNDVRRIDPATNTVDLIVQLGAGANPYNYSDMTGTVLIGTTNPSGTWRKVLDGGFGADWEEVFWNKEAEGAVPGTTGLLIEARVSDDLLTWTPYLAYLSGDDIGLHGRYLEVRATLSRVGSSDLTPVLSDLMVNFTPGSDIPEPGTLALLATAMASLAGLRRRR
ncbi:PEP-CTERM sorting domain-containing protein [Accumulibacter sp.]|uniref:PEP-CTERM sorting domain-containing protein n=1 Tax=Accumulibacter sp. TaxID=2053492 RepID=UPI0026050CBE|nr:PEP-CTERM sorting domain-containing protein [Accumulibacter sp.]